MNEVDEEDLKYLLTFSADGRTATIAITFERRCDTEDVITALAAIAEDLVDDSEASLEH